jgi:hypothetical protein
MLTCARAMAGVATARMIITRKVFMGVRSEVARNLAPEYFGPSDRSSRARYYYY